MRVSDYIHIGSLSLVASSLDTLTGSHGSTVSCGDSAGLDVNPLTHKD